MTSGGVRLGGIIVPPSPSGGGGVRPGESSDVSQPENTSSPANATADKIPAANRSRRGLLRMSIVASNLLPAILIVMRLPSTSLVRRQLLRELGLVSVTPWRLRLHSATLRAKGNQEASL